MQPRCRGPAEFTARVCAHQCHAAPARAFVLASTAYSNIAQSALKAGLAAAGTVAGLITSAVGMALGLWDIAKGVQQLDKSERAVNDILEKHVGYEIHLEFGPDPDLLPAGL
jgi:hypothetical protein